MRKYRRRKSYKHKPCPNNGVRCGKSTRCWPAGTVCQSQKEVAVVERKRKRDRDDKEKNKEKVEHGEKHHNLKLLLAGAATVGVVGAGLLYVKSKQGALVPKKAETKRDPQSASDTPVQRYNRDNIEELAGGTDAFPIIPPRDPVDEMKNRLSRDTLTERLENQKKAQNWAQDVLNDPDTVILDLETTAAFDGVNPMDVSTWKKYRSDTPGIFQIGIVDGKFENAWDINLNPERKLTGRAKAITGKSDEDIKKMENYPTFKEYYPHLKEKLEGKRVIAFNSSFDLQVLDALCYKNGLEPIKFKNRVTSDINKKGIVPPTRPHATDAMHWFATYKGKRGRMISKAGEYNVNTSIAYTPLPTIPGGKAHDALTDVISTYDVLRIMAEGKKPYGMRPSEERIWNNMQNRSLF